MLTRTGKIFAAILTVFILAAIVLAFTGCTRLMDLDSHIWDPLTQTAAEKEAAKPPPTVEIIASILAIAGFGGMANWVRRLKCKVEKTNAKLNNHEAAKTPA